MTNLADSFKTVCEIVREGPIETSPEIVSSQSPWARPPADPVLGMPEWHEPETWVRMGLWDCVPDGKTLRRVPDSQVFGEYYEAVKRFGEIEKERARPLAKRRS